MKRKLLLFLLLFALLAPWAANAQTTVTIGDGTATSNTNPIGTYYNYSITEQLYTAEEIGMAGTISSISFYYMGIAAKDIPLVVYMANVDAENLSTGISLADADEVFNGTLPVTTTAGWVTITLDTPFAYDGTSNLLIGCIKDYLYYFSGQSWQGTATTTTMARYTQSDSAGPYTTSTVPSSTQANRPNIQMVITAGSGPVCDKPETMEASNVTTNSATLTWTGGSGTYNVEYMGGSVTEWTSYLTNTTATTANLTGLTPGTTYQYRVQSVCGDQTSGWKSVSFMTQFGIPLVEGFGTSLPSGWAQYSGKMDTIVTGGTLAPVTYGWNFGTNNGVFDSHARTNVYGTSCVRWLVMPTVTMENNVQLSFDLALTAYSGTLVAPATTGTDDKFVVLINAGRGWSVLRQWDNAGSEYVYNNIACTAVGENVTIDLSSYAGQQIAIAFYAESTVSNADNNLHIDNVSIDYIPACAKPTSLAASEVTARTAKLSWVSDATAWVVAYKTADDADFTEVNATENPFTLTGLTPEKTYTVKVRANCDGTLSEWSNTTSFTTLPSCIAPTGLTRSELTYQSVKLDWTSEASEWVLMYIATASNDTTTIRVEEKPYILTGLAPETAYKARVRANCGEEDGVSAWTSFVSFTTPSACAAPTNLTCTALTATTATLSWVESGASTEWEVICVLGSDTARVTTTSNPYTFTGLTTDGAYTAKVRPTCSATAWSAATAFEPTDKLIVGTNSGTTGYLPSNTNWNYSLTQQIFTVEELGAAGYIESIDFFMTSATASTRTLDIYMVNTDKSSFANNSDWIVITDEAPVFSGSVTFNPATWTTIQLNGFVYDGTSNVAIIVNDHTGSYSSRYFRSFTATASQAIYVYNDDDSYDPTAPTGGTVTTSKNMIRLVKTEVPDCLPVAGLTVNYTGGNTAQVSWTSDATAWNMTLNGVAVEGPITNPYTLTNLELGTKYVVEVQADCGSSQSDWVNTEFTTDACMPEDQLIINYTLTDSYGDGWNGNYILVVDASCDIVEALTISSGSTATGTLKICGGYAQFLWFMNGSNTYPGETSWVFTDSEGNTLFQGEGSTSMANYDILYTIDSNPVAAPSDIMASEVGPHSAKLSWTENGTATAWQIMLNEDEENIIDANTNPFVLTGLDPETEYFVQVRAVTATGTSMWPCVGGGFTTDVPCPAPEVSVVPYPNSAEITMEGWAETYDIQMLQYSYTPSADALWLQYDDGTFATNIGNEGNYIWTWGVMYPASMLTNSNYLNKIAVYEIANYYTMANYTVEIYTGGDDAPGTLVHTESVAPAGIDGFHEVMLSSPVTIDPTQNLWITVTATGSYVLAACETTEANNQWVLSEDEEGNEIWANIGDLASSLAGYGWMIRGYIDNIAPDMNWTSVASGVASPYTLEGLDPETTYSIRVKALCGGEDGESEWTPTVTFTTPAACDAPNTLTATDVTGNSATLNWIGYQDRFNVRYRTTGYDEYSFFEDFENGLPSTWTTIDADGDGNTWYGIKQDNFAQYCHSGTGLVTSASYASSGALTPDNWLITPQIELQGTMKVWMRAQDPDWAEEHYAIYLSTTGNTVDDFTTVLVAETYDLTGEYIAVTADLSAYAGQQGYIAIRHFNCTDMFRINVDDFGIVTSSIEPGEWIDATADEETLAISGLTPETEYEWQVQGVNCDGEGTNTEWSEMATFTTGEQTNLTQTVALAAGTNWFSTYVEITLEDLQAALDAVNTNNKAITIKTQNANSNYIPRTHRWSTPASFIWDVANMYQIVLTEACEITLEGAPIDPTEHEITIAGGGNSTWIGFPFSESMTLTNAFAALPPTNGDVVRYQSANAAYARNRWSTAIANLEPGKGYIYVSAASAGDRTLVFPTNAKRAAKGNVINPSDNSASSAISFPTDARKAAKVIDLNLNVKNTAKDTPYRIMKKAIKGVAKTVDETLTEIIK